jgi:hypothetical protein
MGILRRTAAVPSVVNAADMVLINKQKAQVERIKGAFL